MVFQHKNKLFGEAAYQELSARDRKVVDIYKAICDNPKFSRRDVSIRATAALGEPITKNMVCGIITRARDAGIVDQATEANPITNGVGSYWKNNGGGKPKKVDHLKLVEPVKKEPKDKRPDSPGYRATQAKKAQRVAPSDDSSIFQSDPQHTPSLEERLTTPLRAPGDPYMLRVKALPLPPDRVAAAANLRDEYKGCHFPIDDVKSDKFHFCGLPKGKKKNGDPSPYCQVHEKRVHATTWRGGVRTRTDYSQKF